MTAAGILLRWVFLHFLPQVTSDSQLYADIARNWLAHGIYGLTENGTAVPTCIRLPGYPAFLAAVFAVFGQQAFRAALWTQIVVDLATCFAMADLALRVTTSPRAAKAAFLLAALCPFLANYSAAALTETLTIFTVAVALDLAAWALNEPDARVMPWTACGLVVGTGILLRPDGGLLLAAIAAYLSALLMRRRGMLKALAIFVIVALLPLVPWTARNWHTLHVFRPLAPRYANNDQDFVAAGFNRWVKTWIADYVSTEEIYWNVPGDTLDVASLPTRAFDSPLQQTRTVQLFAEYNESHSIGPELDAKFSALAEERVRSAPLRYYVRLPLLRIADMWLRPRTELLPSDTRWWQFDDDPRGSVLAMGFGTLNFFYLLAAMAGFWRGGIKYAELFLLFVVVRSVFLGTLENPEPRYTLEMYPVIILGAAACIANWRGKLTFRA